MLEVYRVNKELFICSCSESCLTRHRSPSWRSLATPSPKAFAQQTLRTGELHYINDQTWPWLFTGGYEICTLWLLCCSLIVKSVILLSDRRHTAASQTESAGLCLPWSVFEDQTQTQREWPPLNTSSRLITAAFYKMWPWTTKPVIRVNFLKLRFMHHLKAE